MKICILSDLHGFLPKVSQHSQVIVAGDVFPLEIQRFPERCLEWLTTEFRIWAENKDILLLWGNHDFLGDPGEVSEENTKALQSILNSLPVTTINDKEVLWNGLRVYGYPWGNYPGPWAFCHNSEEEEEERLNAIPEGLDLLITHDAPKLGDFDVVHSWFGIHHVGNQKLLETVMKKKPKYHFFGHIHEGTHRLLKYGDTRFRNVSIKNDDYKVYKEPYYLYV